MFVLEKPEGGLSINFNINVSQSCKLLATNRKARAEKAAGLGVAARDYTGSVLGLATGSAHGIISSRVAEAMAIREGLKLAMAPKADTVMIESDARAIVQNVNSANAPPTDVEVVVRDCIELNLMNLFSCVRFDYVSRKCKEPFLLSFPPDLDPLRGFRHVNL